MTRLSFYVLKQLLGPVALFAFLMTCVIWLTQSLRLLDLIINRGQSATTFAYLRGRPYAPSGAAWEAVLSLYA